MKLFIVAALVSVAAAARLDHLERGYLPPFGSQGQSSGSQGSFGSSSQGFDSNVIDSAGAGTRSSLNSAFPGATINQYLPPDHGPSGRSGSNGQFSGSLTGFQGQGTQGSQGFSGSQYPNQYGSAYSGFNQPRYQQYPNGNQNQNQFGVNRQYLAPRSSFQNVPQQAFDEQTGYHY